MSSQPNLADLDARLSELEAFAAAAFSVTSGLAIAMVGKEGYLETIAEARAQFDNDDPLCAAYDLMSETVRAA